MEDVIASQFSHSNHFATSFDSSDQVTFDIQEDRSALLSDAPTADHVCSDISNKRRRCSAEGSTSMIWPSFMPQQWYRIYQVGRREGVEHICPSVDVVSDKGFEYVEEDSTWIYYRRNHIQLSVSIDHPEPSTSHFPHYLEVDGNLHHIEGFYISIRGIKHLQSYSYITSAHDLEIEIYQTNSKREKKFERIPAPANVTLAGAGSRVIIPRLHFRRATANNARKNGVLSKSQEFFRIVVTLSARCGDRDYPIVAKSSAPLIVRTGHPHSPSKFDSASTSPVMSSVSEPSPEMGEAADHQDSKPLMQSINLWSPGKVENSLVHHGNVGINTDDPRYELTVNGNIACTGNFFQPSDRRIKSNIVPIDIFASLSAINRIRVYDYHYSKSWAATTNKHPPELLDRGVVAQEVYDVLPHAVTSFGDKRLADGTLIDGLMVVNKDLLFTENIGATQAISRQVDILRVQVDSLLAQKEDDYFRLNNRIVDLEDVVVCSEPSISPNAQVSLLQHRIDFLEKVVAGQAKKIERIPSCITQQCSHYVYLFILFLLLVLSLVLGAVTFNILTHSPSDYDSAPNIPHFIHE